MRTLVILGRGVSRLSTGFLYLGGIATLILCALVMIDVILRYVLRRPLGFTDEIGGYLLSAIVFLGAAGTEHINVEPIFVRLERTFGRWARIIVSSMSLAVVTLLTGGVVRLVWSSYTWGARSMGMFHTPLWIAQMPLGVGVLALWLNVLNRFIRAFEAGGDVHGGERS